MTRSEVGLIGLAVMGQNLAMNIASKGFKISVWNRTTSKVDETQKRVTEENCAPQNFAFCHTLEEFVQSIARPRKIIILIQAGNPVDMALKSLYPLLEEGDIIIDGGNEWFENTNRRASEAESKGFRYLGMGISGGEEGARHGPSLMPGGNAEAFELIKPMLTKIAAQVEGEACVTYIGKGGAGNFVKMVHNGIEYGDMQVIAEAYGLLSGVAGLTNDQIADIFQEWNASGADLKSFLVEITVDILRRKDDLQSSGDLLDMVSDRAGAKGTGKLTIQNAAERGVPCPTIETAVGMRNMSNRILEREKSEILFGAPALAPLSPLPTTFIKSVGDALYCSKLCCYAQGFMLLKKASEEENWNLNFGEIARIWKGGCIIRAIFLDKIRNAFEKDAALPFLLLDPYFAGEIKERVQNWRQIVLESFTQALPVPALSASLAYFDSFRASKLPTNLIQAQRDLFGAHTYERVDRKGAFHSSWK